MNSGLVLILRWQVVARSLVNRLQMGEESRGFLCPGWNKLQIAIN